MSEGNMHTVVPAANRRILEGGSHKSKTQSTRNRVPADFNLLERTLSDLGP